MNTSRVRTVRHNTHICFFFFLQKKKFQTRTSIQSVSHTDTIWNESFTFIFTQFHYNHIYTRIMVCIRLKTFIIEFNCSYFKKIQYVLSLFSVYYFFYHEHNVIFLLLYSFQKGMVNNTVQWVRWQWFDFFVVVVIENQIMNFRLIWNWTYSCCFDTVIYKPSGF